MNTKEAEEILKDPIKLEKALKKLFDGLDKEKKGYIEPEKLKKFLMERAAVLGFPPVQPPKEREEAIKKIADPKGLGKVDFNGFKDAHKYVHEMIKEMLKDTAKRDAEVKRIFEELDKDKKGYLSIPIMEKLEKKIDQFEVPILYRFNDEEKNKLKKIGDPNGTGKLTFEGCKAIANHIAEKAKQDKLL